MKRFRNKFSKYLYPGKAAMALCVILWIVFCMTACGVDDIDISGYENEKVKLIGLTDKTETVTIGELKKMKLKTVKTESTSDKIGVVRATGPLIDEVMDKYGCKKEEFSKIIINGEDNYDIKLKNDFFTENDLILAFGIDGEPLDEESIPLRLIIPKSDSAYWIRMIKKITFVK